MAEDAIIKSIEKNGASCFLVSEECGTKTVGERPSEYVIVDSVDGTTNATHTIPFFATSIALADGPRLSRVKVGLVMDLYHSVTFSAERGKGAYYNGGTPLRPPQVTSVGKALIGINFNAPRDRGFLRRLTPLIMRGRKFRHLGANALEVCYVASGALDAFIDIRGTLRVTDIAAAYLVLKEAGGIIVTPEGAELDGDLKPTERLIFVAASNSKLCEEILSLIT